MPGLTGASACREARALRPQAPRDLDERLHRSLELEAEDSTAPRSTIGARAGPASVAAPASPFVDSVEQQVRRDLRPLDRLAGGAELRRRTRVAMLAGDRAPCRRRCRTWSTRDLPSAVRGPPLDRELARHVLREQLLELLHRALAGGSALPRHSRPTARKNCSHAGAGLDRLHEHPATLGPAVDLSSSEEVARQALHRAHVARGLVRLRVRLYAVRWSLPGTTAPSMSRSSRVFDAATRSTHHRQVRNQLVVAHDEQLGPRRRRASPRPAGRTP